jgi:hypothetical protein
MRKSLAALVVRLKAYPDTNRFDRNYGDNYSREGPKHVEISFGHEVRITARRDSFQGTALAVPHKPI